jgi:hypothetical protein
VLLNVGIVRHGDGGDDVILYVVSCETIVAVIDLKKCALF